MLKSLLFLILSIFFFANCHKENVKDEYIPSSQLPDFFDLRDDGYFSPIKDQGSFGSCWAFACIGLTEYVIKRDYEIEVDLSEQHLVNCAGFGPFDGIAFLEEHGVVLEEDLPYSEEAKDCNSSLLGKFKIEGGKTMNLQNLSFAQRIDSLKCTLTNYGPVISHMDYFSDLSSYTGGIYIHEGSSTASTGHIIVIVGYKDETTINSGGYWICRNSAGASWGEDGYFKIAYDNCN